MENNKQSSVEWLVAELNQELNYIPITQWDRIKDLIQRAKAMHKQEIINAWIAVDNEIQRIAAEQYYNEKYGS